MATAIRNAHLADLPALYRICLRTGWSGADATPHYQNPDLLGHLYAGPYAALEPDLCFVATRAGQPMGYVLGTADSARFHALTEAQWFPALRAEHPLPEDTADDSDARMIRRIHLGHPVPHGTEAYPAHLHIDLLPALQGQGLGRKLLDAFFKALEARGVRGVHLGVGTANPKAIGFYEHLGFRVLAHHPGWLLMGLPLPRPPRSR